MKRVILRVMMLVAMASAAVTMSVHTSSKEVKASEKGDAVVEYEMSFLGCEMQKDLFRDLLINNF